MKIVYKCDKYARSSYGDIRDITDQLFDNDSETDCWTCGSEVKRDAIESTLERLQLLYQNTLSGRNDLPDQIDELPAQQKDSDLFLEESKESDNRSPITSNVSARRESDCLVNRV